MSGEGLKHSSAAFVEHLRTAHFALVTISVGLILIIGSLKRYDPSRAWTQIEEVLELQKNWSPKWVLSNLRTQVDRYDDAIKKADQTFAIPVGQAFPCAITGPDQRERGFGCLVNQDWIEPRPFRHRPEEGRKIPSFTVTQFPSTLWEFHMWWDTLTYPVTVSFAHVVADGNVKGPHPMEQWMLYDNEVSTKTREGTIELHLSIGDNDASYFGSVDDEKTSIQIPVEFVERCKVDHAVLRRVFSNWGTGSFKEAFSDLAEATGSLEQISLSQLESRLAQEAAKGQETFDAFGLKVPVTQLTLWGSVLLLSIQVYFYVHLKELDRKLGSDDPGWDVPWVAMYESRVSKMLFLISSCVLPVIALGLLAYLYCEPQLHSQIWAEWRNHRVELLRFPSFAVVLFLSITMACLAWKYKPAHTTAAATDAAVRAIQMNNSAADSPPLPTASVKTPIEKSAEGG